MRFYALDFDRTLGRTADIARGFAEYIKGVDPVVGDALQKQQHNVEATGGSFDMMKTLRTHMNQHALSELVNGFLRQCNGESYLEDGAEALLTSITAKGHRVGIVTYGGEDWQTIKLQATNLDSYHRLILGEKGKKGSLIASWYDPIQCVYYLPDELGGGVVKQVILVDDKPVEFAGLPDISSARGYLYTGSAKPASDTSSQPTDTRLPSQVITAVSLMDVVRHEGLE